MEFRAVEDGVFPEAKSQTPEAILVRQESIDDRINTLFEAIGNNSELQQLYDAITEHGELKPPVLAEKLQVDVTEIYNRLRNLRRRIARIHQTEED